MILVTVKNSKTGSQYICKTASKTVKDIAYKHISYHFVCRHKDHPFFKQLYHGPKGIYRFGTVQGNRSPKKSIWNTPMHELLDITIEETPLDGRTRYAKQLPVYNVDVLTNLTMF
jgi:hypothetical protein